MDRQIRATVARYASPPYNHILQDTPGPHHQALADAGYDLITARGPLTEAQLLDLIEQHNGFDAVLCGDDKYTARVIDALLPKCQVLAKYGIGLDAIDLDHATASKLPVLTRRRKPHHRGRARDWLNDRRCQKFPSTFTQHQ